MAYLDYLVDYLTDSKLLLPPSLSSPLQRLPPFCRHHFPLFLRGGFMQVQHVRPNRGPTKGDPHRPQNVGQHAFLACGASVACCDV